METTKIRIATIVSSLLVVGSGCNDETTGPTEAKFEQLCGQTKPLRILAVDPAEVPEYVHAVPFGDRYVIELRYKDGAGDTDHQAGRYSDVWSVGQCGADPVLLATEVDVNKEQYERYPELFFACRDDDERAIVALDPTGASPANDVFATHDCFAVSTPVGLVTILAANPDDTSGTLVLQPWPDDPLSEVAKQIVLLDDVKLEALPNAQIWSSMDDVLAATDDEVFVVTAADELVVVSLDNFGATVLATGVREFDIDPDGRRIMWQGVAHTSEVYAGPLSVIDRATNQVNELGDGVLESSHGAFLLAPVGALFSIDVAGDAHYFGLDSLEPLGLPSQFAPIRVLDDGRVFLGQRSQSPYIIADITTGETSSVYDGNSHAYAFDDVGMLLFEHKLDLSESGELVHLSYSGQSTVLAKHVIAGLAVASDHRVVTSYAIDDDRIGQLVVVNPDELREQEIADNVLVGSISIDEPVPGELIVSFLVVDSDPDQHGVWVAKPAK